MQDEDALDSLSDVSPVLARVLESAATLQRIVPDAVLVGGTAAAQYAGPRDSLDHDHVLPDLRDRFDVVLEAIESTEGWVTNRVVPGKLILGQLGDIETGVRQMIRKTPLEIEIARLPSGSDLRVPTLEETLRIKAYLIVRRNQTRDFLDVAALAVRYGIARSGHVLSRIDSFYTDQHGSDDGVASQLARQLSEPHPADRRTTKELAHYKGLQPAWQDWNRTVSVCKTLAAYVLIGDGIS